MARTYKRDARGRFSGGGGGSSGGRGGRPATKRVQRGTNRLTRDNSGKITGQGGSGATARGGRLKTAAGNQRATQLDRLKGRIAGTVGKGGKVKGGARAKAVAAKGGRASLQPQNMGPKGKKRWLSNDQVVQANEARGSDIRNTASVFRSKFSKKEVEATEAKTLGGYIAKVAGKPLPFATANKVRDRIEKVTGVGYGKLQGVRVSIDNARKTVTYNLTSVARKQASIAEKVGSRKPRRRR
jgi:hypothetical protein